ncbi:MAG: hypothetical protein WA884_02755 [Methyloceanibacter sp.]
MMRKKRPAPIVEQALEQFDEDSFGSKTRSASKRQKTPLDARDTRLGSPQSQQLSRRRRRSS